VILTKCCLSLVGGIFARVTEIFKTQAIGLAKDFEKQSIFEYSATLKKLCAPADVGIAANVGSWPLLRV
jgi:hypothetical protein